jgi:predicted TIM-barrel fold metal-dependent hydrolase
MKIVDAHHHLWAPQTPALDIGYVWLKDIGAPKPFGDPTPIQRDYLLDEFLNEPAPFRLAASVHVQADQRIPDPVAETAFIQSISDQSGHPIMIVGYADLASGDCANQIEGHKRYPNLRGIRQILSYLPDRPDLSFVQRNLLDDLTWRAQFPMLADHGLSFDLQLYPQQMTQAAEFLAEHPGIPVIIDHLGSPFDASPDGMALWDRGMAVLAELDHVHVKLSGYAMFFGPDLDGPAIHVTQRILELFGPDRVMFGSNFPVDALHLTYGQVLEFVLGQIGQDEATVKAVFSRNTSRLYGCNLS